MRRQPTPNADTGRTAPPMGSFIVQCFIDHSIAGDAHVAAGVPCVRLVRVLPTSTGFDLLGQLHLAASDPVHLYVAHGDGTPNLSVPRMLPQGLLCEQLGFRFPYMVRVTAVAVNGDEALSARRNSVSRPTSASGGLHMDSLIPAHSPAPDDDLAVTQETLCADSTEAFFSVSRAGSPTHGIGTGHSDMLTTPTAAGMPPMSPSSPAQRRIKRQKREEERRRKEQLEAKRAANIAEIESRRQESKHRTLLHAVEREATRNLEVRTEMMVQIATEEHRNVLRELELARKRSEHNEREQHKQAVQEHFTSTMTELRAQREREQEQERQRLMAGYVARRKAEVSAASDASSSAPPALQDRTNTSASSHDANITKARASVVSLSEEGARSHTAPPSKGAAEVLAKLHATIDGDTSAAAQLQEQERQAARDAVQQEYFEHVVGDIHAHRQQMKRQLRAQRRQQEQQAIAGVSFEKPGATPYVAM